ncbi:hypothetical protein ECANGB1_2240 [Enterospora canceri]|uniref:Uncharacterized protein n=1 Tax=Enterospora canceri TaxID=1081671 RepID=A0A1Y1S4V1_9MICR|nr:hypothetical protein ECANGB1_2240 [Enterospora canceri]
MYIDLISANVNDYNAILLENDIRFVEESNDPMIDTEQAKISYKKRKDAIEAECREIRRCQVEELKSMRENAYIMINDLMIAENDIGNYVKIGKCTKRNVLS